MLSNTKRKKWCRIEMLGFMSVLVTYHFTQLGGLTKKMRRGKKKQLSSKARI